MTQHVQSFIRTVAALLAAALLAIAVMPASGERAKGL